MSGVASATFRTTPCRRAPPPQFLDKNRWDTVEISLKTAAGCLETRTEPEKCDYLRRHPRAGVQLQQGLFERLLVFERQQRPAAGISTAFLDFDHDRHNLDSAKDGEHGLELLGIDQTATAIEGVHRVSSMRGQCERVLFPVCQSVGDSTSGGLACIVLGWDGADPERRNAAPYLQHRLQRGAAAQ
eukprot:COSAG01_NODE_14530_length_1442_cov_1.450484_1_plen_185_part_10